MINQKLIKWVKEIGKIPNPTCPQIDNIKDEIFSICEKMNSLLDEMSYTESTMTLSSQLSYQINKLYNLDYKLEELREENAQLRKYGTFWYKKCLKMLK